MKKRHTKVLKLLNGNASMRADKVASSTGLKKGDARAALDQLVEAGLVEVCLDESFAITDDGRKLL